MTILKLIKDPTMKFTCKRGGKEGKKSTEQLT